MDDMTHDPGVRSSLSMMIYPLPASQWVDHAITSTKTKLSFSTAQRNLLSETKKCFYVCKCCMHLLMSVTLT